MTHEAPQKWNKTFWIDLAERVAATAAEAGVAYAATQLANISPVYAVPIGAVAAVIKGWLAKFIKSKDTASLVK